MSIRTDRVSKMVQREVADLLQGEFHETSQSMLTVTGARVTKDLSIAYVDVSVLGETPEARRTAFKRLEGITPQVRVALAARIRHQVRRIPELRFYLDESALKVQHMEGLFAQIRAQRDEYADAHPDEEGATEGEGEAPDRQREREG